VVALMRMMQEHPKYNFCCLRPPQAAWSVALA